MDRYKNGKIYKIIDNTNGNIYIGSTCEPTLARRLARHRGQYKQYLKSGGKYITLFQILENNDCDIILLEDFPCETKDQLLSRERYYIENNECVNKVIPPKEYREQNKAYSKKWKEQNQDKIKIYNEKYQKQNHDKLKNQQKEYYKQNQDIIKEKKKDYYERNRNEILTKNKDYYKENKATIKDYCERNRDRIKQYQKEYREKNKE